MIRDVVTLVHSDAILHNTHVLLELNAELPPVRGNKIELQQVALNLLLNAFDAMSDCPANERQVPLRVSADVTGMVKVMVRDCGIGLSSEQLGKIFEPFYTTKRDGLAWGSPSVTRLSKPTAAVCGRRTILIATRRSLYGAGGGGGVGGFRFQVSGKKVFRRRR